MGLYVTMYVPRQVQSLIDFFITSADAEYLKDRKGSLLTNKPARNMETLPLYIVSAHGRVAVLSVYLKS